MTDYLALLKQRIRESPPAEVPSKPSKDPFEGFEGYAHAPFLHFATHDERLAFLACRAGIPREWIEGFSRLDRSSPLVGFSEQRWRLLIDDGCLFLECKATDAARLGWHAADVFGIHPTAPASRFDQMGLVPLIAGSKIANIEQDAAHLITPGGSRQTFLRCLRSGDTCLWDLPNERTSRLRYPDHAHALIEPLAPH